VIAWAAVRGNLTMLQHLPVEQPQEPLSHLQVGPQGHPALALAAQAPLAQPHLPVAQPQSPSLQAQEGPQVQGILVDQSWAVPCDASCGTCTGEAITGPPPRHRWILKGGVIRLRAWNLTSRLSL